MPLITGHVRDRLEHLDLDDGAQPTSAQGGFEQAIQQARNLVERFVLAGHGHREHDTPR